MDQAMRRLALGAMLASFPGTTVPDWALRLLDQGLAGYVLFGYNVVDPDQLRDLVSRLREVRPDAIVGIDEEGGDVTRLAHAEGSHYPGNAALGAADDTDLTRQVYRAIGAELHNVGINLDLAPDVDVNSSDENPIIGTRSFGTDPTLVARHTAAAVVGLQSAGVAACAKHFPGHGATVGDSHHELPTVDATLDVLRERELPPFVAAIQAGARSVMTAHIRVPALTGEAPATLSARVLTDLLRGELGFTGAVLTDALEMRGASATIGIPESAVQALAAGADVAQPPLLGAQVPEVAAVGRGGQRFDARDVHARRPEALDLAGVVGEQARRAHAQRPEDRGAVGVVAGIDGPAEGQVGVDRVGAPVLLDVGPQFVDQPDAAALVAGGVHEHAPPGGRDGTERKLELDTAVAAQRAQRIAREALGVHPGEDVVAPVDLAAGERQVDEPRPALEGPGVEDAERRGQGHPGQLVQQARAVRRARLRHRRAG